MYEDPFTSPLRPAPAQSQDISHVLESIFKDVLSTDFIGEDTVSNLIQTNKGRNDFHTRYVEELKQNRLEYEKCIKDAQKLENHIIQARIQAAAKENHAHKKMTENVENASIYGEQIIVKSFFPWCVDEYFLEENDLISPQDYLPRPKPITKAPEAVKHDPTKPTISFIMHTKRDSQDEEDTPIVPKAMTDLDLSLTFDSGPDIPRKKSERRKSSSEKKPKPKWKDKPLANELENCLRGFQKLKSLNNFPRNKRFIPLKAEEDGGSLIKAKVQTKRQPTPPEDLSPIMDPVPVFLAKPPVVCFTNYNVGQIYEMTLELRNVSTSSRNIRIFPPTTRYFSVGLGRFPSEGGVIAPGMSCKYTLRFAPDSVADYKDFVVVETQDGHGPFVVPVEAYRPPPILTLPKVMDCGACLVGELKMVQFLCQNIGLSTGTFCIIPQSQWSSINLRSVSKTYFSEQTPFALGPSLFELKPGESIVVEVAFTPTAAEKYCQVYAAVCDNCQVKEISVVGEGQLIDVSLVSVSGSEELPLAGQPCDLIAEHYVPFGSCNPHSVIQKQIVIRNSMPFELPYFWQVRQPYLYPLEPGEIPKPLHTKFHTATEDIFTVNPPSGQLLPFQDTEFQFIFHPKKLKKYHGVCQLLLRNIPTPAPEPSYTSIIEPLRSEPPTSDVVVMEIEVEGLTEPHKILLEPYAVIIPEEIFIFITTRRRFKMWNHSKTFIYFKWEHSKGSCHILEVQPSQGRIEENECVDFDLLITGGKQDTFKTKMVCHIKHHHLPIILPVEVSFKGPTVTVNVPSLDFGLVRLGDQVHSRLELTNITQLEAPWTLKEKFTQQQEFQESMIILEPFKGLLLPLTSCKVDLTFTPRLCEKFETGLELEVENGQGCHLCIRADVQSPQVHFLKCKLVLTEIFLGAPARGFVTLFNGTVLQTEFKWRDELQGEQASLCKASFNPSSGTLGPNEKMEIAVDFVAHTDVEVTAVAALCDVEGMDLPLVLGISSPQPKKLSVRYSVPDSPVLDKKSSSMVVLDFGKDVVLKKPITKRLLITNETAIPASFDLKVEHFFCHAPKKSVRPENTCIHINSALHQIEAEKLKVKAHAEFVNRLLDYGRGAAFQVVPESGLLGAFETQTVAVTAHTDMWGEYTDNLICKVGDIEAINIPMRMTVKGCPLYFLKIGPNPENQTQGPTVRFGTSISGGDTLSQSFSIINPTVFDIRVDWEIYNLEENDFKLVDLVVSYGDHFPPKDADGKEFPRETRKLPEREVQVHWEDARKPGTDKSALFRSKSCPEMGRKKSAEPKKDELSTVGTEGGLIGVHIQPHIGSVSDYPYCITPQQIVIPKKGSATIYVSYTPLTVCGHINEITSNGLAFGYISLDSETAACIPGKVVRAQGLDLEPIRMNLLATVKPALLLVEINEEEDDRVLEFNVLAGDFMFKEPDEKLVLREFEVSQTIRLRNTFEMSIQFRIKAELPFSVLRVKQTAPLISPRRNPSAEKKKPLVVKSQDTMQVSVTFHCSPSLLDIAEQPEVEVPPGVTLVNVGNGLKKLKFEGNLCIHHSNNCIQTVPLRAHMYLCTLSLSTDEVNFGFCCIGVTYTKAVTLHCKGSYTYWRSFTDECDPRVFNVTPGFGLLRSIKPDAIHLSEHLQISFTPSEDREFKAVVFIQSPLVKSPLTLNLQGIGLHQETDSRGSSPTSSAGM